MSYIEWFRKLVGHRKVYLVFSSIILRDANGRILLQHRTDFDCWGLPGGVLEIDEDIETCARRELAEETGLIAGDLGLVGVYTHPRYDFVYPNGDQVQQYTICFSGQTNGGRMRVDGFETSDQAFYEPAILDRLTIPLWYQDMIRDALRGGPPAFSLPYAAEKPVDQITNVRPFINTKRLIAVGASAATVREDGRILVVQRKDNNLWDFPAGYSEIGENVAQTAVRETFEETGFIIYPERIIGVFSSSLFHETFENGDQVKNVGTLFRARLVGGDAKIDENEANHMAWMTPDELRKHTSPHNEPFMKMALNHLHNGYFIC